MNYCYLLAVENLHHCEILIEELTLEDSVSNYQNSVSKFAFLMGTSHSHL